MSDPSQEQKSKTTHNFEAKRNTNWPLKSDIEIIMISNCETMDHSGKDCHHQKSRKLLFATTRKTSYVQMPATKTKTTEKQKSNDGPIKSFEKQGENLKI